MPYAGVESYAEMMQMVKKPRPKRLSKDEIGKLMLIQFGASQPATWRRHLEIMVMLHYIEPNLSSPGHYTVNWDKVDEDFEKAREAMP